MSDTPNVRLRAVYKIFGAQSGQMMDHVREGVSKEALLSDHSHVLGLQNINFDMKADEITVVTGLSGSGKSTLIRHLNRLIEPTAGEILLHGKDVTALSRTALRDMRRKNMAMVFQKFALAVRGASTVDQDRGRSSAISTVRGSCAGGPSCRQVRRRMATATSRPKIRWKVCLRDPAVTRRGSIG